MNLFQCIVLPLLALLVFLDARGLKRRRGNAVTRAIRMMSWIAAALLIANPMLTSRLSELLGIGRGSDLVVYLFMLAAPLIWFHMQAQLHSVQRQMTQLARIEAIRGASFQQRSGNDSGRLE